MVKTRTTEQCRLQVAAVTALSEQTADEHSTLGCSHWEGSVAHFCCLLVTIINSAKTAEPIEMSL